MTDHAGLSEAVQRYFNLLYDNDVSRFDRVFLATASLHGFSREGKMTVIPAPAFKDALAGEPSLKTRAIPRHEEILLMDFASATQALVKVRVRWGNNIYLDYLTYHRVDGDWLVTAKGFHIEETRA
jgi:hypothetical protein